MAGGVTLSPMVISRSERPVTLSMMRLVLRFATQPPDNPFGGSGVIQVLPPTTSPAAAGAEPVCPLPRALAAAGVYVQRYTP
eukprot:scaffold6067_cov112-Isochrysis_galbana.AAC.12